MVLSWDTLNSNIGSGFVTIPGLNPMAFNPHAFSSGAAGAAAWASLGGLLGLAGVDLWYYGCDNSGRYPPSCSIGDGSIIQAEPWGVGWNPWALWAQVRGVGERFEMEAKAQYPITVKVPSKPASVEIRLTATSSQTAKGVGSLNGYSRLELSAMIQYESEVSRRDGFQLRANLQPVVKTSNLLLTLHQDVNLGIYEGHVHVFGYLKADTFGHIINGMNDYYTAKLSVDNPTCTVSVIGM
jgi:hypothetical protein